jgi:hypothetical protein
MPGWYLHLDIARNAIKTLERNQGAGPVFTQLGPSAASLTTIAEKYPAFTALGAIGPDIFFLLPDFMPGGGQMMWGAAQVVKKLYDELDPWIAAYTDQFTAINANSSDILDNFTGGLSSTLANTISGAMGVIRNGLIVAASTQYDVLGLLSSGVPKGYDEQAFFWSDMLHYRKTYEFASYLWDAATALGDERYQAFAMGWMTHLAADVTGHCFVNQKCGGPYRLHWQRHHLVENHMDAHVYDSEYRDKPCYQDITRAAMHLWIAFDDTVPSQSHTNFLDFSPDDRPTYSNGNLTPDLLDRRSKWDYDSEIPEDLATFVADCLKHVYGPATAPPDPCLGAWADHPTNLAALSEINGLPTGFLACPAVNTDGYPTACDIETTYWWLYEYMKKTTTDYYNFAPPTPPSVWLLHTLTFPSPPPPFTAPSIALPGSATIPGAGPGTGAGSGGGGGMTALDLFELLCAILAWIDYLIQIVVWFLSILPALLLAPLTYPLRELIYEYVLLPLYNVQMAFHWYLAMIGYVHPRQSEISPALTTLGEGSGDIWAAVEAALLDPLGGLVTPISISEPSGNDVDPTFPHEVIIGPPSSINPIYSYLSVPWFCGTSFTPTGFLRPWSWPGTISELPLAHGSPYGSGTDATALLGGTPGSSSVRLALEGAVDEADTNSIVAAGLAAGQHLGDPVDYTAYVIAQLTRDPSVKGTVANFNLDADRGYGYLCWDWVRSHDHSGTPAAYGGFGYPRRYQAPERPGYGWCSQELDLVASTFASCGPVPALVPHMHVPGDAVMIRYLDREYK